LRALSHSEFFAGNFLPRFTCTVTIPLPPLLAGIRQFPPSSELFPFPTCPQPPPTPPGRTVTPPHVVSCLPPLENVPSFLPKKFLTATDTVPSFWAVHLKKTRLLGHITSPDGQEPCRSHVPWDPPNTRSGCSHRRKVGGFANRTHCQSARDRLSRDSGNEMRARHLLPCRRPFFCKNIRGRSPAPPGMASVNDSLVRCRTNSTFQ